MSSIDRGVAVPVADRDSGSADPLIRALESVYLSLEGVGLVPGPLRIPVARLADALGGFAEAAAKSRARLVIEVTSSGLETVEGPLDARQRPALTALGNLLHALEIRRLEIGSKLGREGLARFIEMLDSTRRTGSRPPSPPAVGEEAESIRVIFAPRYESTSERIEDPADDAWEALSAALQPGSLNVPGDPPMIDLPARDTPRARTAHARSVQADGGARRRFVKQVAALNPRLRRDLLRVSPKGATSTWAVLAELNQTATPAELLDSLEQLERAGARLTDQTLTLINKLIRLSGARPSSATAVCDVLDRWGVDRAEKPPCPAETRRAAIDVLRRREKLTFNPKPYQSLLDRLSRHEIAARRVPSLANYRDAGNIADIRVHAAEIAARLLSAPGGDRERPGLFAYIGTASDVLIAQHKFDLIRDAAVAARGYGLIETEHHRTQRAAQRYLDDFSDPERIRLLLEHGCSAHGVDDAAASLLVLGGVVALGKMFDKLASHPCAPVVRTLRALAADRSLAELEHVIEWRAQRGWRALRPVFPVIGLLRAEDQFSVLESLFVHSDPRVRRQAITMADRLDGFRLRMLAQLERELQGDEPANAAVALTVLIKTPGDDAVEVLGRFATRHTPAEPSWQSLTRRCITALAERGSAGIERLCMQLRAERGWRRSRMQVAVRIAAELDRFRATRRVDHALREWRRSPVGRLARLLRPVGVLGEGR